MANRLTSHPRIPSRSLVSLGLSLPPRRGQTVSTETLTAARAKPPVETRDLGSALGRLLRPQSAYRWLLPQLAAITPQYIEATLRGALAGNHVQAWELFDLMQDTWPELSACTQELSLAVQARRVTIEPHSADGLQPDDEALHRAEVVNCALRRMRPDVARDENDLTRTIADIVSAWFVGQAVCEVMWTPSYDEVRVLNMVRLADGTEIIAPRGTCWVHPVCYAWDMSGRLGLRMEVAEGAGQTVLAPGVWQQTTMQPRPTEVREFPRHKFLVAIHKAKAGTPLGSGLLRVLAWWWCSANFSADWLLNLAQVFGLPFRWANYAPEAPQGTIDSVCTMLENMGSAGWAAFPAGTTLELKDTGKTGDMSPQGNLLDRADRYARMVILGQTMSGGQDASKGGGKAFGQVETGVKEQRIEAAARFAGETLGQLADSILHLNFGDCESAPKVCLVSPDYADEAEARRDLALAAGGLPISIDWIYRKYDIAKPDAGAETLGHAAPAVAETPDQEVTEHAGDAESERESAAPAAPLAPTEAAPDVQATALNGAQVAALVQIASEAAARNLPIDTAQAIARAAFPLLPAAMIADIFAPLARFTPATEAAGKKAESAFLPEAETVAAAEAQPDAEAFDTAANDDFAAALAADMERVRTLLAGLEAIADDAELAARAVEIQGEIDKLRVQITQAPAAAQALANVQVAAFFNGITKP